MLPAAPPAETLSDSSRPLLSPSNCNCVQSNAMSIQIVATQFNVHPAAVRVKHKLHLVVHAGWQHDAGIYNHLWSPLLLLITWVSTIGYLSEGSFMVKHRFPLDLVYFQNLNSISQNTKSSQRGFYFDTQSSPKYLPTLWNEQETIQYSHLSLNSVLYVFYDMVWQCTLALVQQTSITHNLSTFNWSKTTKEYFSVLSLIPI